MLNDDKHHPTTQDLSKSFEEMKQVGEHALAHFAVFTHKVAERVSINLLSNQSTSSILIGLFEAGVDTIKNQFKPKAFTSTQATLLSVFSNKAKTPVPSVAKLSLFHQEPNKPDTNNEIHTPTLSR